MLHREAIYKGDMMSTTENQNISSHSLGEPIGFSEEEMRALIAANEEKVMEAPHFSGVIKAVTRSFSESDWRRWTPTSLTHLSNAYNKWMNYPIGWINVVPVCEELSETQEIREAILFPLHAYNRPYPHLNITEYRRADNGKAWGYEPKGDDITGLLVDVDVASLPYLGHAYDDERVLYVI